MSFFTTTAGLRIYYETHGEPGQPTLVMLHGLGSNTRVWEPQMEAFSRHFRLVLMDFPGHGKSDNVIVHRIGDYARIVAELMDALDIRRAHFMGLSLGCAVALTYGLNHPERTASFILQGPVGGLTPPWLPWGWPKMLVLILYLAFLGVLTLVIGKRRVVRLMNVVSMQTKAYNPLLESVEQEASPLAKICLTLQSAYPPYIGKLHRITVPVLVIAGEKDPFPRRYYEYVVRHVSGASEWIRIPGGKHVISLDNPDAYNQLCLDFLSKRLQ